LNDHKTLRGDVLMQTAVGRDEALASAARSGAWRTGLPQAVSDRLR